jgi:fatty-acyl-CoA synthase
MRERHPPFTGLSDIEAFERIPLEQRIDAWTVHDLLRLGASYDPDKPALLYLPEVDEAPVSVTYRNLLTRVNHAANLFAQLSPDKPPVVALMAPPVPEAVVCLYSAPTAGTLCPLNWMASPERNARILRDVGANVLVTLGPTPGFDISEKAAELVALAPGIEHVLEIPAPGGPTDSDRDFVRLLAAQPDTLAFDRRVERDTVAIYCGTGGTTGAPKLARLTHGGIAYHCFAFSWCLDHGPGDTMLFGLPLFFSGGIVPRMMNPLARGVTNLIVSPIGFRNKRVIENLWEIVERHGVTELNLVPTLFARLLGHTPPKSALRTLKRHATSGSSQLLPGIAKRFEAMTGIKILGLYGLTEYSVVSVPPLGGDPRYGASGIRVPYTELKIAVIDEAGHWVRECAVGETGTIVVRGPGKFAGYDDGAANVGLLVGDGWLNTGDRGYLDADGYLWVTGRIKDLIIRGGVNIDARVIEEPLLEHPAIAIAAAVGKPDPIAGEIPVAYVQAKRGVTVDADEIRRFAHERIVEQNARPAEVYVLESMPLTDVGKVAKAPLRLDAARRAFEAALAPVAGRGVSLSIEVAQHPKDGLVPTIKLGDWPNRSEIEALIGDTLACYVRRYIVESSR